MEAQKLTLHDYLIENGISIEEFSGKTGLSIYTIYRIWNNKYPPGYKSKKLVEKHTDNQVTWNK